MRKVKIRVRILISILILIAGVIIFNIYNNNQISVITEEVKIENLPDEFNGYTILQIADLHSKSFGRNQKKLTKIINKQNFDMIAICGDMQGSDEKYENFIALLKGIKNNENVFYTPGNYGPYPFKNYTGFTNFIGGKFYEEYRDLTEVGEQLKDLNVKFLNEAYEIKRGDSSLWISELLYKEQLSEMTNTEYEDNAVNIAITHYPIDSIFTEDKYIEEMPQYDLVLAGHYHGGQWRIPFIGALYIPDLNSPVYFPDQDRVSGLTEACGIRQYVTRGLGASGSREIMRFRLFNRPEINLIKLVKA